MDNFNIQYINNILEELEQEFQSFGTIDGNKLITILSLSLEENIDIFNKIIQFCKKTFLMIIQKNCKNHQILRSPYLNTSNVDDKTFYSQIYGYRIPQNYPPIFEFYNSDNSLDITYISNLIEKMEKHDSND